MMLEMLAYIGVIMLLLGVGYAATDRCIRSSIRLRLSVQDVTTALHAGEQWRTEVRSATAPVRTTDSETGKTIVIPTPDGEISYRFFDGNVLRHSGQAPWVRILSNVKHSTMEPETRHETTIYHWELELQPRAQGAHMKPLFTFLAATNKKPST
jgi:hypothetical protein